MPTPPIFKLQLLDSLFFGPYFYHKSRGSVKRPCQNTSLKAVPNHNQPTNLINRKSQHMDFFVGKRRVFGFKTKDFPAKNFNSGIPNRSN